MGNVLLHLDHKEREIGLRRTYKWQEMQKRINITLLKYYMMEAVSFGKQFRVFTINNSSKRIVLIIHKPSINTTIQL